MTVAGSSHPAGGGTSEARRALLSKPVAAVLVMLALSAVADRVPGLTAIRVFRPSPPVTKEASLGVPPVSSVTGEAELELATDARGDLAQPERVSAPPRPAGPIAVEDAPEAPDVGADESPIPLVDGARLAPFFESLARTERREAAAVTRVVYFGDSVVASDFGTGTLRRLLQQRFGDAGHGFVLVANAWPQYFHNDVHRVADPGFRVSRIVGPRAKDGLYGLGGVSFSAAPGLHSRIGTAKDGTFGRRVSRFEIAYVAEPGGGGLEARVDGNLARTIDTSSPDKRETFAELRVPDGEHELELRTVRGNVRLFGVVLERDEPGVVLDAIGVVGARMRTLDESDDADFAAALAWRRPNLVVFQFGANESGDGFAYPMPEYHRTMKELIEKVFRAVPGTSCLVVGAMDRARKENDRLVTVPIIPHIVEEQRKVASEAGCAYYSLYEAMGGRGSMAAWVRRGYGAGDFTHPTSWGAEKIGKWLYSALGDAYATYKKGLLPRP